MPSRLIQLTIETLSRVICEKLPSEAMTHLAQKSMMATEHVRMHELLSIRRFSGYLYWGRTMMLKNGHRHII